MTRTESKNFEKCISSSHHLTSNDIEQEQGEHVAEEAG